MRPNRYFTTALFVSALSLLFALPALAQYGSGVVVDVPYSFTEIVIDGVGDDAAWDAATFIDLVQNWEAGWVPGYGDANNPEAIANARLLWREGVLYVLVYVEQENHDLFFTANDPWQSSHLLVGVDLTGEDDEAYDHDWGGWPENAPDQGAVAYKINPEEGVTLNWGFDDAPDPVAEGWVEAAMVVHEGNRAWTLEMAIHGVDDIDTGAQIGFNIAGAISSDPPGHEWGWFLYSKCDPAPPPPPGGETRCAWAGGVQSDARGFALLNLTGGPDTGEGYGTGVVQQVPRAKGPIELDGQADEAAWADAVEVDLTEHWDGFGGPDFPDVISTARMLWDDGVLYLHIISQHPVPLWFNPDDVPWGGNQFLIGVDLTHEGDDQVDSNFDGWPHNAPNHGPTTYKINPLHLHVITSNWSFDVSPIDTGWVAGVAFVDDVAQEWGIEMAIFGEEIMLDQMIGFNVGGAAAREEDCPKEGGECTYAYYSWQSIQYPGGDVMHLGGSFGSLHFVVEVSGEEGATAAPAFSIRENFPNPFGAATTVVYELEREGAVELALYDVLGRRVALVDEGPRAAGEHQVRLDGSGLASGLYMVRLSVDGQPAATHMMMRVH